ncbi:hypothetical protein [Mycobacterium aquaticum]|nr:hypothetical protein [Mycobacterium aquaticum]
MRTWLSAAAMAAALLAAAAHTASADPSAFNNGYGNAQDTVNALRAQGYDVQLNGAAVYPLSSCRVTGIEGLRNSNSQPNGNRIDPTESDTVYVDISCRGG